METKELTLQDYVSELGITAKVTPLKTIRTKENWAKQGWRITLKYQGRTMGFNFYGGGAVKEPDVSDGVWCQALERSGVIDNSFGDWCREFGYSTDSREAFNTYLKIKANANRFSELIGSDPVLDKLTELAVNY